MWFDSVPALNHLKTYCVSHFPDLQLKDLFCVGSQQPAGQLQAVEQPDTRIITEPIRMDLVRVPAGEFLMGSHPAVDREATRGKLPQHRLYLAASPSLLA